MGRTHKNGFINSVLKELGNDYASVVDDGVPTGDISGYIDTGSYIINAQISGSIHGGIPDNKVTVLAGHEATGKTFFCVEIIKNFLEKNDEGYCFYFESEGAISKDMFSDRRIDTKRIGIIPVSTVQEFRTQCLKLIRSYKNVDEADRKPILLVLDSLGNLSTTKEMEDSEAGKETRDMTRAQLIKGTFRVITLALSKVRVPLLVTNHTYQVVGSLFASKEMGGGSGIKFAGSTIIFLSRGKDKDSDKNVTGNIIFSEIVKSRFTKQFKKVVTLLSFEEGLHPYYGLLELGEKHGIFKKVANKYEMPDGTKEFRKAILKDPETYFTDEVMDRIEEVAKKEFCFGNINEMIEGEVEV